MILYRQGFVIQACLLIVASLLDILQAMTLSQKTVHAPFYIRDIHQVTAWLMAAFYLVYLVSLAAAKQVDVWIIVLFLLGIVMIYLVSTITKHQYFRYAQMGYFVSVSIGLAVCAIL